MSFLASSRGRFRVHWNPLIIARWQTEISQLLAILTSAPSKIVIMHDTTQAKLLLETLFCRCIITLQDLIDIVDNLGYIGTTVLGHAQLDWVEIFPLRYVKT